MAVVSPGGHRPGTRGYALAWRLAAGRAIMGCMTTVAATEVTRLTAVPDTLGDLKGPAEGTVELPVSTCWYLKDRTFDLDDPDDRLDMYEAVLGDGTLADITGYLNAGLLVEMWAQLRFDRRRREGWEWLLREEQFPGEEPQQAAAA